MIKLILSALTNDCFEICLSPAIFETIAIFGFCFNWHIFQSYSSLGHHGEQT